MFDSFIIERIRQEEESRRRGEDRPRLDVPLLPPGFEPEEERSDDAGQQGVVVIGGEDEE